MVPKTGVSSTFLIKPEKSPKKPATKIGRGKNGKILIFSPVLQIKSRKTWAHFEAFAIYMYAVELLSGPHLGFFNGC